jgi:hypothetical protein
MRPDHVRVRSYFAPPAKSYWHWQEHGRVAVWNDGVTIAFREEIELLLTRLAGSGLPPLGSVLLLLSAWRDNWNEEPNRRTFLHTHLGWLYGGTYSDLLAEVLTGLGRIYERRSLVRGNAEAKAALAAAVFEDVQGRYAADESQFLAKRFALHLAGDELEWKPQSALDDLLHDLGCLRSGLSRLNFEPLDLRLKTGLESLPRKVEIEPPPPTSAKDLIATLQDDPELGGVARLARLLLAAIQLPRALSDPDDLPIGGFSDIANRGALDRLLISELANDDLTLAVRVAMNEALYLRRESPPHTPPQSRRVLLDAGLRTWGVPRVFVAAVGLALVAKAEPGASVTAFRAEGVQAVPIDLHSSGGLRSHLEALDHHLHPGESLRALAGRQAADETDAEASDCIVVTTEDTLAETQFQRAMEQAAAQGLYLATVTRDGRFALYECGRRGRKLLAQARFDLDDVITPRPKAPRLYDERRDRQLPAFLHQTSPPLRFSAPIDLARAWLVHPGTAISYVRDGRLLLWDAPNRGGRQIASGLNQKGNLLWCDSQWQDGRVRLVVGKRSRRGLQAVTYDRQTDSLGVATLMLTRDQPTDCLGLPGALLVFFGDGTVEALSWETGELLARRENFVLQMRYGRFLAAFRAPGAGTTWLALAYHAGRGNESIDRDFVCQMVTPFNEFQAVFQPIGHEEILGITASGEVRNVIAEGGTRIWPKLLSALNPPFAVLGVSRDGRRVLLTGKSAGRCWQAMLDIDNQGKSPAVTTRPDTLSLEQPLLDLVHPRDVHRRFTAIGLTGDGQLTLLSPRGIQWPIMHDVGQRLIRFPRQLSDAGRQGPLKAAARFQKLEGFAEGYELSMAQWPDGSRAWLDSRGLLHLRSSRSMVPECTLVLADGPLAGWLSNGCSFGPAYWKYHEAPTVTAQEVWDHVLVPFTQRLA